MIRDKLSLGVPRMARVRGLKLHRRHCPSLLAPPDVYGTAIGARRPVYHVCLWGKRGRVCRKLRCERLPPRLASGVWGLLLTGHSRPIALQSRGLREGVALVPSTGPPVPRAQGREGVWAAQARRDSHRSAARTFHPALRMNIPKVTRLARPFRAPVRGGDWAQRSHCRRFWGRVERGLSERGLAVPPSPVYPPAFAGWL